MQTSISSGSMVPRLVFDKPPVYGRVRVDGETLIHADGELVHRGKSYRVSKDGDIIVDADDYPVGFIKNDTAYDVSELSPGELLHMQKKYQFEVVVDSPGDGNLQGMGSFWSSINPVKIVRGIVQNLPTRAEIIKVGKIGVVVGAAALMPWQVVAANAGTVLKGTYTIKQLMDARQAAQAAKDQAAVAKLDAQIATQQAADPAAIGAGFQHATTPVSTWLIVGGIGLVLLFALRKKRVI